MTPSRLEIEQLQSVAIEYGFAIVAGDSLSLILGAGAEVAKGVEWLLQNRISSSGKPQTVGLGCTKQDLALLEAVDIPIVIPTLTRIDPALSDRNYQTTNSAGVSGWIESIEQICRQYL